MSREPRIEDDRIERVRSLIESKNRPGRAIIRNEADRRAIPDNDVLDLCADLLAARRDLETARRAYGDLFNKNAALCGHLEEMIEMAELHVENLDFGGDETAKESTAIKAAIAALSGHAEKGPDWRSEVMAWRRGYWSLNTTNVDADALAVFREAHRIRNENEAIESEEIGSHGHPVRSGKTTATHGEGQRVAPVIESEESEGGGNEGASDTTPGTPASKGEIVGTDTRAGQIASSSGGGSSPKPAAPAALAPPPRSTVVRPESTWEEPAALAGAQPANPHGVLAGDLMHAHLAIEETRRQERAREGGSPAALSGAPPGSPYHFGDPPRVTKEQRDHARAWLKRRLAWSGSHDDAELLAEYLYDSADALNATPPPDRLREATELLERWRAAGGVGYDSLDRDTLAFLAGRSTEPPSTSKDKD